MAADELNLGYRHSRFKEGSPAAGDLLSSATFRLEPASPRPIKARLDEIRRWRQAQPLGIPTPGAFFRNPPRDRGGRRRDRRGRAQGHPHRRRQRQPRKHANFLVNDGTGRPPTSAPARPGPRGGPRSASGTWSSSATGRTGTTPA